MVRRLFIIHYSFVVSLVSVAVFLCICGGVPGFRDGAHFYAPLFQYLFEEFSQGRLPLWNPYDNYGQPLAANPATAAFYPVMWAAFAVHYFCGIDTLSVYAGYCGFHLLLAMLTMYRLARRFGGSPDGSALAALSYALGGQVLFQWNNVPFLIGAAYLPEAVSAMTNNTVKHSHYSLFAVHYSLTVVLMVLGGDPQSAYNAVIISSVLMLCRATAPPVIFSLFLLFVSLLLAFFLAAVQVLPAIELGLLSDRTSKEHQQWITYFYSIHPLRLTELFFPNAGGVQFPVHCRWFNVLNETGIWTASLYAGLLPAYFAVKGLFSKQSFSRASLPPVFLFFLFLLASLGNWCFVYQFFNYLPGYSVFRYPAKLMTPAVMFFAVFAAKGFDRKTDNEQWTKDNPLSIINYQLSIFLLPLTGYLYCTWFRNVPPCPVFGPFDADAAKRCLLFSFGTAAVVLLLYYCARKNARQAVAAKLVLLLVFFDLTVSNYWLLAPMVNRQGTGGNGQLNCQFTRTYPDTFLTISSPSRLTELIQWEQQHCFPRYNLMQRQRVHGVKGTLVLKSYAEFNGQLEDESIYQNQLSMNNYQFPSPNRCEFTVELDRSMTVIVPEQYYPGWQAFITDSKPFRRAAPLPVIIKKSPPCFRAVDLPAGKHTVVMIYNPPLFKIGAALSILGVLCVIILLAGFLRKSKYPMKHILLLAVLFLFLTGQVPPLTLQTLSAAEPVKMIFDTDLGNDVDDTMALAAIHALQNRGECELLAVTTTKDNPYVAPMIAALNKFYGRPNIPIAVVKNGVAKEDGKYNRQVLELKDDAGKPRYSYDLPPVDQLPEAVSYLRKRLAAEPD
ncbi:MAG: hypothetical protein LBN39_12875, partial [Planctomycetaceae bacterium]|nr:hypothetical protein [Planctomycetaceae bacterium]